VSGNAGDQHRAIESLERLGLSNYEARVFIALQKLGVGTAKEVHDLASVPRSQVYGAAESLEERGLIELQRSNPLRYRPVSLGEARERLTAAIERETDHAFGYLEGVRAQHGADEGRGDVWTVRGRVAVDNRVVELAEGAEERLLYAAASPDFAGPDVVAAFEDRAAAGVGTSVVSEAEVVRTAFEDTAVRTFAPNRSPPSDLTSRILVVDDRAVLLSVVTDDAGDPEEVALWSADTPMATVLVRFLGTGVESFVAGA